jgi:hypothetical protein
MDIESVKIDIDGAYGDQGGYGESQGYYGDVHVDPAPSSEGAPAAAGDGASASDEEFNNLFK